MKKIISTLNFFVPEKSICRHYIVNQLIHIEELRRAYFGHEPETVYMTELVLKIGDRRQIVTELEMKKRGSWYV